MTRDNWYVERVDDPKKLYTQSLNNAAPLLYEVVQKLAENELTSSDLEMLIAEARVALKVARHKLPSW